MGWFGSLQLAYKYAIIFGSLLIITLAAGAAKVIHDRRQLQKHTKREELEATGAREEVYELHSRELDGGDLFGIRAIESGYYGGVAQSRPTSAAGSHSPSGSISDTLMGSHVSLTFHGTTPTSSMQSLPIIARQPSPLASNSAKSHDTEISGSPKANY
ncbi:MAG: integral membrane [Lasallia pustulata]|nr:MAG: integral membrane [Lasallia pustulata]